MKIVDEKGKIFGKLNIIDLLVMILLIAAIALVALKISNRNSSTGSGNVLVYTVKVSSVEKDVADSIEAQVKADGNRSQLMASGDMLNAWVTSVSSRPHEASAKLNTNIGGVMIPVDEDTVDLTFTIEANVTNTVTNEVGTQEVRVGKSHIVKTTTFELDNGVILSCEYQNTAK
ncbi:MAG: DUF4330 domain-containing protein [Intestinimonas sp.]|jgi:hypothetical protein|nr:DUF4330 domain-containing protein [Intestinimonas sp.]